MKQSFSDTGQHQLTAWEVVSRPKLGEVEPKGAPRSCWVEETGLMLWEAETPGISGAVYQRQTSRDLGKGLGLPPDLPTHERKPPKGKESTTKVSWVECLCFETHLQNWQRTTPQIPTGDLTNLIQSSWLSSASDMYFESRHRQEPLHGARHMDL